jgi:phosphoenolpyruvate---glycerone phosphotransferase subunit DhaK
MKKIINHPSNVVDEMLDGMVLAYPQIVRRLNGLNVLVRAKAPLDKVALVSGGGSGHEPAHGGFVGRGMLDAAVAGAVFTSPTPDQVFEAIKAVDAGKGVLLVIKNYTGDVLNFDMAAEMAEAEGIRVEKVVVNDDVAVENSTFTSGRRGIAGTLFVHKIAGAKAEEGGSLDEVKAVAEKVIANVRSMGMAISPCTVPEAGKPSFELKDNEMEIGIGIHGEPGIQREPIQSADKIADILIGKILDDMPLKSGDETAILVNGLGSTPLMELFIINRRISKVLAEKRY